ncbi:MAG: YbaK/EbsC family protein [Gammaproteobacteria bacterium]|nr:YbaK/EbsC family protein [Gammaproteobacteria bacterium]
MTIAQTVNRHLNKKHIDYQVVHHRPSGSSLESARSAHVNSQEIAKGILLRDEYGYVLAVVPASRELDLKEVEQELGRRLHLAKEYELNEVFTDCAMGAVPAVGPAYGLETVADTHLRSLEDIYFESGDHEELIHVAEPQFEHLMEGVSYKHISRPKE